MWEYYHDGGEYFDIIWLGLVAATKFITTVLHMGVF